MTSKPEIRLNLPDPYDGSPGKAREFLQACEIYLGLNSHIYDDDRKKILFMLSFCSQGSAAAFTSHMLQTKDPARLAYRDFENLFKAHFLTSDVKGEAKAALDKLKQKDRVDAYINEFKILAHRAGITDYEALVQKFQTGLKPEVLKGIYFRENLPTDMEGWYKAAQQIDQGYERLRNIRAAYQAPTSKARDPDTMDVDVARISAQQREQYLRDKLCFQCGKPGHQAWYCRQRRNGGNQWNDRQGGSGGTTWRRPFMPNNGNQGNERQGNNGGNTWRRPFVRNDAPRTRQVETMVDQPDTLEADKLTTIRSLMRELTAEERDGLIVTEGF